MLNFTQDQVNHIVTITENAYRGAEFMASQSFNVSDQKQWADIRATIGNQAMIVVNGEYRVAVKTVNDAINGQTRLAKVLSMAHKAYVANEFAINMIAVAI